MLIGGIRTIGVLDTGSTISLMSLAMSKKHRFALVRTGGSMEGAFPGVSIPRYGKTTVAVVCGSISIERATFEVSELHPSLGDVVIGMDLFYVLGFSLACVPAAFPDTEVSMPVVVCTIEEQIKARSYVPIDATAVDPTLLAKVMESWKALLTANASIAESDHIRHPLAVLHVDTGDTRPIFIRQYPVPQHRRAMISERVDEWARKGWIEKAPDGNPWSFPLLAVDKKDADGNKTATRVCIDLRKLNESLEPDNYPLPLINETLRTHAGHAYFGSFDAADSYQQMLVHPQDRHKVSFIWENQQWMFMRAMFGVKTMTVG
jgi:hypothetical protein